MAIASINAAMALARWMAVVVGDAGEDGADAASEIGSTPCMGVINDLIALRN
jgi:hypothetical protein